MLKYQDGEASSVKVPRWGGIQCCVHNEFHKIKVLKKCNSDIMLHPLRRAVRCFVE